MIKKAICPNCGAEGTVGRYCEFCGTKIVELKKIQNIPLLLERLFWTLKFHKMKL